MIREKLLRDIIIELENTQEFISKTSLWASVVREYNTRCLPSPRRPLSVSVLLKFIKEFDIAIKTKSAKGNLGKGIRVSKSIKYKNDVEVQKNFRILYERTPKEYHNVIKSVEKGSVKAAIKLNCLTCYGFDQGVKQAIRECNCYECPMHHLRPYK